MPALKVILRVLFLLGIWALISFACILGGDLAAAGHMIPAFLLVLASILVGLISAEVVFPDGF